MLTTPRLHFDLACALGAAEHAAAGSVFLPTTGQRTDDQDTGPALPLAIEDEVRVGVARRRPRHRMFSPR
jgi:hypothetical protein